MNLTVLEILVLEIAFRRSGQAEKNSNTTKSLNREVLTEG